MTPKDSPRGAATSKETNTHPLEDADERCRAIFEAASDCILSIDERGRIETLNGATERVFGYDRAEMIGQNVAMLMPEYFAAQHDTFISNFLETGERRIIGSGREVEGQRADGSLFPIELSVTEVILPSGRRVFGGIMRDISSRKNAEDELRAVERRLYTAQRLESVGALISGIAHDFRNLMLAVQASSRLALGPMCPPDEARRHLEAILRETQDGTELLKRMMTLAREEREEHTDERTELGETVAAARALLKPLLGSSVTLTIDISRDEALWVHGRSVDWEHALINLAINARHAMPQGGRFTVVVSTEHAPGAARQVRLEVSDTGHGMDEATKSRALEPFFTTKPPGQGTGLGLARVHGLVQRAGGKLEIESALGAGTRFIATIPWLDTPTKPTTVIRPSLKHRGPILLIEDHRTTREATLALLASKGHQVIAVADAVEALDAVICAQPPFGVVVTDLGLPRGDVEAVLEASRIAHPEVRTVIVTGRSSADPLVQRLLAFDHTILLEKPYDIELLFNALEPIDAP